MASAIHSIYIGPMMIFITKLYLSATSWAVPQPLRSLETLEIQSVDSAYQVKNAHVVLADYQLLRRDFPKLLKNLEDREIDQWLLENAALIAYTQVVWGERNGTNS